MNNHHYPAETPDDLDLYEHDALEGRIPSSARGGRKSSRILEIDEDGGFDDDGRIRKGSSRRDADSNPRRRSARPRGEFEFDPPPPPRQGPVGNGQGRGAPPRPYSSGGARMPDSPRSAYNERSGQGDSRPIIRPSYGNRPGDSRGPGYRPAPPMDDSRPSRPPMRRDEGQDMRGSRPVSPRVPPGIARPGAQQQPRFQPNESRREYGNDPQRRVGPTTPPPGGNGGSRAADSSPRRPDPRYDKPRQFRRDDTRDSGRT